MGYKYIELAQLTVGFGLEPPANLVGLLEFIYELGKFIYWIIYWMIYFHIIEIFVLIFSVVI